MGIFSDHVHDFVEVFMDDFFVYGNDFIEELDTKWVVLSQVVSQSRIELDPAKIEVI